MIARLLRRAIRCFEGDPAKRAGRGPISKSSLSDRCSKSCGLLQSFVRSCECVRGAAEYGWIIPRGCLRSVLFG